MSAKGFVAVAQLILKGTLWGSENSPHFSFHAFHRLDVYFGTMGTHTKGARGVSGEGIRKWRFYMSMGEMYERKMSSKLRRWWVEICLMFTAFGARFPF